MRRPSAAMIVATIALVFALTGAAGATTGFLITSTHQISPKVLKQLEKRGPRGFVGPHGAQGSTGATGVAGTFQPSDVTIARGTTVLLPSDGIAAASATCPVGSVVVGGGWHGADTPPLLTEILDDGPITAGWTVTVKNEYPTAADFYVDAICAS